MSICSFLAASRIVEPSGTLTSIPLIFKLTIVAKLLSYLLEIA